MQIICKCGKRLIVKGDLLGKLVKCPGCGQTIRVAENKADAPPAAKEKETPQLKNAKRKPVARRSSLPWILGGVGAFLVVVLAVVLVFVFTRTRNSPESGPPVAQAQNSTNNRPKAGQPVAQAPNPAENRPPVVKVQPGKEGETWKSTDLINYLRGQGIKCFAFGKPFNSENDASVEIIETLMLADDDSAAARAPKTPSPIDEALDEQKKGIGVINVNHYRSAAFASQQPLSGDESSLVWGRFIITVVDPQPKGSPMESGNRRSRMLVQQIRKALGLKVVSVEWPAGPTQTPVSSPPTTPSASKMNWVKMSHEKGKYSILFPGTPEDLDPMVEGAPISRTLELPDGVKFDVSFTVGRNPFLKDEKVLSMGFDAFFRGMGEALKADLSKRTSLKLGEYPGQECLSLIPSQKQHIRCRYYVTEERSYDLSVTWPAALHPANWSDAKKFLDSFKLTK